MGFLVGTCGGLLLGAVPAVFLALAEMTQIGRARVEWVVGHVPHVALAAGSVVVMVQARGGLFGLLAFAFLAIIADSVRRELVDRRGLVGVEGREWALVGAGGDVSSSS